MDKQVLTVDEFFDVLSDAAKNKYSQRVTLPVGDGCVDAIYRYSKDYELAGFQTLTVHYYESAADYTPAKTFYIKAPVNSSISKSRLETLRKKIESLII